MDNGHECSCINQSRLGKFDILIFILFIFILFMFIRLSLYLCRENGGGCSLL